MGERMNGRDSVERYLKRATYGLWGCRRREVMEELEVHILERVKAYRLRRLSEEEALARALAELGEPAAISAGMLRLHVLPKVLGVGTLAAIILSVALTTFVSSLAQELPVLYRWPSPSCLAEAEATLPERCRSGMPWISISSLKEVLEPQGVEMRQREESLELDFPGGRTVWMKLAERWFTLAEDGIRASPDEPPSSDYVNAWTFVQDVARQSGLIMKVEGWTNPTVRVGEASFTVGTRQEPVEGYNLYSQLLFQLVFNRQMARGGAMTGVTLSAGREGSADLYHRHSLGVDDAPGTVYGVISLGDAPPGSHSRFGLEPPARAFYVDVAPVSAEGGLELYLPWEEVTFVGDLRELEAEPADGKAVLIRLSGEFSVFGVAYDVVVPEEERP